MHRALVAALAMVAWSACVDRGPGPQPKKIDPSYVAEHLLGRPPAGEVSRLDVSLGGKVVYVGNTIDKPTAAPGQTVRVTHYWRVVQPVGPGWRVFALVRGAPGTADFMNLPPTDMEIAHGPALWKAGELIEDIQDITLRPDWRSATATLSVGLIAIGQHGPGDRMAAVGPHTQDRAVIARVIEIDLAKAPPPAGTVYVPRATGPITIDGLGSEPAWATAASSPELATAEGSADPVGKAIARLTWDDQFLYALVSVTDSDVVSEYKNHDDPLWKQDCVELFIDADGNRRGYVELQVNPNNATFDSWFATTRAQPGDPSWDSGMLTAVKLRGTTAPGDTDQGWDAEIAIPWQAVRGRDEAMAVRLPPEVGDRWRLNLVRVDVRTGEKNPQASSWNRITSADFHALDRMLTVVFADTSGSIVPRAPAGGAGSSVVPGSGASPMMPGAGSPGAGSAGAPRATGAGSGAGP
ncbi:MAG TPA: carbohydrate-binding family 9-like protein, partial [Kofleriaceae bacterium]|nr:carbohydrate-binding family 9-like protein [Kofleriaceae bacterium]